MEAESTTLANLERGGTSVIQLNTKQRRRIAALREARDLLSGRSAAAAIAAGGVGPNAMIVVAEYIIDGEESADE